MTEHPSPAGNGQINDRELITILRGVSRSFVLTIQALPKQLRRPIGIAYLLARISDTIADTASAPVPVRESYLARFGAMAAGEGDGENFQPLADGIKPESEAETRLLQATSRVLASLRALGREDRECIADLLRKITRGQALDLLRFQNASVVRALQTAEELDEYTYLVAGCVGEFWTRLCCAHLPRYGRVSEAQLRALGKRFGQGLQLVNILRDMPEDLRNGRCYLPAAELRQIGQVPETLPSLLHQAMPVFEHWRARAEEHLECGWRYIEGIRPWRIRFACLLPWALGMRTLQLLKETPPSMQGTRIKVTRQEVGRFIRRAALASLSNSAIQRWAKELAR